MKKFKNTFGITGSTHAINHFAKLAVKEGWYHKSNTPSEYLIFWTDGTFHHLKNIDIVTNIDTLEGLNKALELMKEVEPEQLYGECLKTSMSVGFVEGKIYKIFQDPDTELCYRTLKDEQGDLNGWHKDFFKLVPESAYLEQETKKEKKYDLSMEEKEKIPQLITDLIFQKEKKYDFVCPHSGEGFMFGEKNKVHFGWKEVDKSSNMILSISQENGTYTILISKEIKDKVVIKFE